MKPEELGKKYDKIAAWWHEQHRDGDYGISQIENALKFRTEGGSALDVGCGAGGRVVRALQSRNYEVTGLDVSSEMIKLASENHPEQRFILQDIGTWVPAETFDFVVAWDSLFHVPYLEQASVITKLCRSLNGDGVLVYSFGDAIGEHTDEWRGDTFYYSSLGVNENIRLILKNGLKVLHLELDQYPEKHVYLIAQKR
ncbi:MAG: trans-aconitate 2-methyltransferase [Woeseiaceae bacterium]